MYDYKCCINCKKVGTERECSGMILLTCNGETKNGIDKCEKWEDEKDGR